MKKLEFYATQELGKQHSINPDDIEKIYNGALDCCACGCEGTYTYPSDLIEFERQLKIFVSQSRGWTVGCYDYDNQVIFELKINGRFGIRLYVKKH